MGVDITLGNYLVQNSLLSYALILSASFENRLLNIIEPKRLDQLAIRLPLVGIEICLFPTGL